MKDLSESLWRRRQSGEREPELYSTAFPRKVQPEPETDNQRELYAEVSALGSCRCGMPDWRCRQGRSCPADEPLFHPTDLYIAAIAVAVIGGVVMGVL